MDLNLVLFSFKDYVLESILKCFILCMNVFIEVLFVIRKNFKWLLIGGCIIRLWCVCLMKYYVIIKSDEEFLIILEDIYVIILNEFWFYKS